MFENLSEEQTALVESLKKLSFSDEDIAKSLNLELKAPENTGDSLEKEDTKVEKSIDEQIASKRAELEALEAEKAKNVEKSDTSEEISLSLEELSKSFKEDLEKSNANSDSRFEGLTTLVKSLVDVVNEQNEKFNAIKEENEKLVKGNEEFKKSFSETAGIINKIAEFSPGLKSLRTPSANGFTPRFEKSESGSDKEVLSISTQKGEISKRLSTLLDTNEEIRKSHDNDIASFEVSSRVTPKLQKIFDEQLKIEVVQ